MVHKRVLLLLVGALAACTVTPADYRRADAPYAAPIKRATSDRPLIGLALGGGGARGFAHVGVIKALEAGGIKPDIIAGSSSGAVVAALYAGGYSAAALEEIALNLDKENVIDFTLFGSGWVRGQALQDFVNRSLDNRPIERLFKPFAVTATQASSGKMVVFNRGNTGLAVRASSSIPNLFIPPVINGEEYIDGGLTSPVPVEVARALGADIVIAVDVSWFAQARNGDGAAAAPPPASLRSVRRQLWESELERADVVITPHTVRTRMLDFESKVQNIAAGEAAASSAVPVVEALVAKVAAEKRMLARPVARQAAAAAE